MLIYIFAAFMPPLALLFNGQFCAAILNSAMLVLCAFVGIMFPILWFLPSVHAIIAIKGNDDNRKHRDIVEAIARFGPPNRLGK